MPLDAAQEAVWAAQRIESYARFYAAVASAKAGSFALGRAIASRVRAASGDEAAEYALAELRSCTELWK
jgi:hypothetical protein